ncbi:helix-turn-helix transcriptional regulator [Streptomyces catenulae]|uniref:LuxR C-terminal-related transcriptional regulator n=1 Tax=Streptomyces catenulae TaxID=66875 RepID=A0ABV2Z4G2_9ACTN
MISVVGPRGIGRTRLLDEAVGAAGRLGFRLLYGRPGPPERQLPTDRRAVPTLVVLDGLRRADADTPLPPSTERTGLRHDHIVWLAAHRTGTAPGIPPAVLDDPRHRRARLTLGPLPEEAALDLVADVLAARLSPPLRELLHQAEGHPRLLIEFVRGLREEGALRITDSTAHLVEDVLPERARAYVGAVLDQSSGFCRQLLYALAVLDEGELCRLLGASPRSALPALEEMYATGLMGSDPAHPTLGALARRLVADVMPATLCTALRHAVASPVPRPGPPAAPDAVLPGGDTPHPEQPGAAVCDILGERQWTLLRLVAEGLTNQQIAEQLRLSTHTVNYHLRKLFRVFGVRTRAGLAGAAERLEHACASPSGQDT